MVTRATHRAASASGVRRRMSAPRSRTARRKVIRTPRQVPTSTTTSTLSASDTSLEMGASVRRARWRTSDHDAPGGASAECRLQRDLRAAVLVALEGDRGTAAGHEAGVRASWAWYEDVFAVHRIPTRCEGGLWWALAEPPPWHSAARSLRRDDTAERVLRAVEPFERCSVADSHGTLDLDPAGFQRLFAASWLHREAPPPQPPARRVACGDRPRRAGAVQRATRPRGRASPGLPRPPAVHGPCPAWHQRWGRRRRAARGGATVDPSNAWAARGGDEDVAAMVECATVLHPGRPLVGYAHGNELGRWLAAGFQATGTPVVWVR